MAIEKRGDTYRVRKMVNGQMYRVNFDHKPTKREIDHAISLMIGKTPTDKTPFCEAAEKYVDSKSNVLSPASIGEYTLKIKRLSSGFRSLPIGEIHQHEIQCEINRMAKNLSVKTLKDMNAFIQAVLRQFQADYRRYPISLPLERKKAVYVPTDDDIKVMIEQAKGTPYELAIQLAAFGLRRSEICCITAEDIDGNILHINKALVQNKATKKWYVKSTKTTESERDIILPPSLVEALKSAHRAYDGYPGSISNWLRRTQDKLGLPHFSLHKERHYFATSLADMGVAEADILKMGGWSTDHVMKKVYRHDRYSSEIERQKAISESLSQRWD